MKKNKSNTLNLIHTLNTFGSLSFFLFYVFPLLCQAAVITVPVDYSTIPAAITAASDGDEIIVSPGAYYSNIHFHGKNIVLRSSDPTSPSVVAATIIDGQSRSSVVTFSGAEETSCVLSGFTITRGYAPNGGGIRGNGTHATISYNYFTQNHAYGDEHDGCGGGLHDCDGVIEKNTLYQNEATGSNARGGGLYGCDGFLRNNIISRNHSEYEGAGLSDCDGIIQNNDIYYNVAGHNGGGLAYCDGTIQNNTIYCNGARYGGGLSCCEGFIVNCIIWRNVVPFSNAQIYFCTSPTYSCIQYWTEPGGGNIYADPKMAKPSQGDFHLLPDSPCIDAGNSYYLIGDYIADIDGENRVAGKSVDMGSDEYSSVPDADGDLLADQNEGFDGRDPNNSDSDWDGLLDGIELLRGSNPAVFDHASTLSVPVQYRTIQKALFLAFPSEVIIVSPGIYNENLHFLGKNLILQSKNPHNDNIVNTTIIDGNWFSPVVFFTGTESQVSAIKGLTLRNGSGRRGGGIAGNGTMATIENNNIVSNYARRGGGGVYQCQGIIQNNTISHNTGLSYGGGLYDCKGPIQNNTISDNYTSYYGGGLAFCHGIIQNNIVSGNGAKCDGGGLYECDGTIQNNIILENTASVMGGGRYGCDGAIQNDTVYANSSNGYGGGLSLCKGTIKNCIIWENTAFSGPQLEGCSLPTYSCLPSWSGGTGNINLDPQFVDPAGDDFRLLPSSPCIDAGGYVSGLTQDFQGDPRPFDGTPEDRGDGSDFDIGADEFIGIYPVPTPSPTPIPLVIAFDFSGDREGWTSGTAAMVFSEPEFVFEPGCLKIISLTNTNTFGYWQSLEEGVPAIADYLYRARFTISTDVSLPELVPQVRIRVNSPNFQQADYLTISSNGDGAASPTPEGKSYDLYFVPPENDEYCMLAFDLLNFNVNDSEHAELALESVVVDRFRLDILDDCTVVTFIHGFEQSKASWSPGNGTADFTDPEFLWEEGALHLRSTTNTNTFGYWYSDARNILVQEDRLYRATFEVRTDEPDQTRVPQMRLRFNTENMQASRSVEIASFGDGANSPATTNKTYDRLYFFPPASCIGERLFVAFDILNFNPDDAPDASLILDQVIIEFIAPPFLP